MYLLKYLKYSHPMSIVLFLWSFHMKNTLSFFAMLDMTDRYVLSPVKYSLSFLFSPVFEKSDMYHKYILVMQVAKDKVGNLHLLFSSNSKIQNYLGFGDFH